MNGRPIPKCGGEAHVSTGVQRGSEAGQCMCVSRAVPESSHGLCWRVGSAVHIINHTVQLHMEHHLSCAAITAQEHCEGGMYEFGDSDIGQPACSESGQPGREVGQQEEERADHDFGMASVLPFGGYGVLCECAASWWLRCAVRVCGPMFQLCHMG